MRISSAIVAFSIIAAPTFGFAQSQLPDNLSIVGCSGSRIGAFDVFLFVYDGPEIREISSGAKVQEGANALSWTSNSRFYHLFDSSLSVVKKGETMTAECTDMTETMQRAVAIIYESDPEVANAFFASAIQLAMNREEDVTIAGLQGELEATRSALESARSELSTANRLLAAKPSTAIQSELDRQRETNAALVQRICELDPDAKFSACAKPRKP